MKLWIFAVIFLIISGVSAFIFYPEIKSEFDLFMMDNNSLKFEVLPILKQTRKITPIDDQFGMVIPKINANAKIISFSGMQNLNPPQYFLAQGLARIGESAYPGEPGNMILISHTPAEIYETTRTNPNFYMMYKLNPGDQIYLYFKTTEFVYLVKEVKLVNDVLLNDLTKPVANKKLTVVGGWPSGLMLKRLIVTAEMAETTN